MWIHTLTYHTPLLSCPVFSSLLISSLLLSSPVCSSTQECHIKKMSFSFPPSGQTEKDVKSHETLRWEPQAGRAFTEGGVVYHIEDGGLQVNNTGLYHIYSRVEFLFDHCSSTDSLVHSVFVRRAGNPIPLPLMEGHRAGFCSQRRPEGHRWTTESYLGSTLQLKKQDRVFVNVSHPSNLSRQHHANFFGLYKI